MSRAATHTPGPWHVMPKCPTWIATTGDPYGHGPMHIADVRGWGHLTGGGTCAMTDAAAIAVQDANATLIAAAPTLLAALDELVINANRLCDRMLGGTYEADCRRSLAVARAAMAAAEGR